MVRVLIVDDDRATVSFMRMAFEAAGHSVTTASNVDEAMTGAATLPPDVVLSDLTFGGDGSADGFTLLRSLRDRDETRHAVVLAVSGADAPAILSAAADQGFDGFVSKPVDLASLIDRVTRLGSDAAMRRTGEGHIDRG